MTLVEGTPDIGGSRASVCLMAAEALGVEYDKVRPIIGDTSSLGFTFLTGGSRATFSSGMRGQAGGGRGDQGSLRAGRQDLGDPRGRGEVGGRPAPCRPAATPASRAAHRSPTSPRWPARPAGRSRATRHLNAQGAAPSFGTHIADVEVDPETGQGHGAALHGDPGCRPGHPSDLRRGPVPGRRGAGHRLGAERGVHLRRRRPACRTPASSTTACRWPPTCR